MDISPEQLSSLKAHLYINGLGDIALLLDATPTIATGNGFAVDVGRFFLNREAVLNCKVIKDAEGNFIFGLTAGGVYEAEFAEHFPQMLPFNPWGVIDTEPFPFPHLASVMISDSKWQYIYFSTNDAAKQAALWELYGGTAGDISKLKEISGNQVNIYQEKVTWNGGLFYEGAYKMPWRNLIPDGPWRDYIPNIAKPVAGCVYQNGVSAALKMQVELVSQANPFGSTAIKRIALAFELSSSLSAPESTFITGSDYSDTRVGLSGQIQIGDNISIRAAGSWPIDGDDIFIAFNCKLSDIKGYFNDSSISGMELPDGVQADLVFTVSKRNCSLDKIDFDLELDDWAIVPDVFKLDKVHFKVGIYWPDSFKLVRAGFAARATIGGQVSLICTGNYPDGDFYLGIDPETPLQLGKLINSISGTSGVLPDGLEISELHGHYNSNTKFYSLAVAIADDSVWEPGKTGFKLENISANISSQGKNFNCSLKSQFKIDYTGADKTDKSLRFIVEALYAGSWYFSAAYTGDVSLVDIGRAFGFENPPSFLNGCKFTALSLAFDSGSGYKSLSGGVEVSVEGARADLLLQIDILKIDQETSVSFSGDLTLNILDKQQDFHLEFEKTGEAYALKFSLKLHIASVIINLDASSTGSDGKDVKVSDKFFSGGATGFSISLTDILTDLISGFADIKLPITLPSLVITDLNCTYNLGTGAMNITSSGLINEDTEISFVFCRDPDGEGGHKYAFGLLTDVGSLDGLPLVGDQLTDVKLNDFGFIYTSEKGTYLLNNVSKTLSKGFNLSGSFCFPGQDGAFPLELQPAPSPAKAIAEADKPAPAEPAVNLEPAIKWYKLNKKLGPLSLGQLGFGYNDGRIGLYLQGSLAMASLSMSLNGLGLTFAVNELFSGTISPRFALQGIGLSYLAPPVAVSAAFQRSQEIHEGKLLDVYSGTATIKASDFTITALGSYTQVGSQPSLFIYGLYEGALGGPAFFFVTAVAAGFGYNRRLNIPSVEEVASFPLVALAMNPEKKNPSEVLTLLGKPMKNNKKPLEISIGDYWLAVGIRFSSFKIIESFALLAVNFGTRLEFAIVGLSRIRWPEKSITPEPIVYLEIALVAHFGPDSDVISVLGVITPNSYVISKDCRITGGFAFYTWVSGPHEGDTVVTLGGYHPRFVKPDHYPVVPRLGLNWRISDNLTISGEMYYAITPSAIMAGGKWEINFHLSFLRVNVTVWADMIISWSPYQYELEMGILIKIEADIKISFIRIHFSLEMGAMLHIWGPDFAGEAHVDWAIFSFTIPFGSSAKAQPKSLDWDAFSNGFIPQKSEKPHPHNDARPHKLQAGEKTQTAQPLSLAIGEGIISARENTLGQERFIIVNPQNMSVNIGSFIPSTDVSFNSVEVQGDMVIKGAATGLTYASREKEIGIIPCGLAAANKVKISLKVGVTLGGIPINMRISGVTKGLPGALWGKNIPTGKSGDAPAAVDVVRNALCGLVVEPPPPAQASWTKSLDFSKVFDLSDDQLNWQYKRPETGPNRFAEQVLSYDGAPGAGGRKAGRIELSYNAGAGKRSEVLAMLREHFDESLPEIDDAHMLHDFENGPHYFRAIPVLSGMGQVPDYSTQTAK